MLNSDDTKVYDAFEQLFDVSGKATINLLTKGGSNLKLEEILGVFIRLIFYGLPGVKESAIEINEGISNPLNSSENCWNLYNSNPSAAALSACIIQTVKSNLYYEQLQARQLVSLSIPIYVAFLGHTLTEFADDFLQFKSIASPSIDDFEKVVKKLTNLLTSDGVKKTSAGVQNLIDALMFIRERRVEEVPLTFEINLGPFGLWETIEALVTSRDQGNATSNLNSRINTIKKSILYIDKIGEVPTKIIANEVEDNAKHFGRGVATLKLSDTIGNGKIQITVENIWKTHSKAPLSNLYGFDWDPPVPDEEDTYSQLHLVLLPSGIISIQTGGDPLLEYFAGGWRYVDIFHKSIILSKHVSKIIENIVLLKNDISLPIYRCCRLAYQLSYHNHGSTIELNFGDPMFLPNGKLQSTVNRGGIFNKGDDEWREIRSRNDNSQDTDNNDEDQIVDNNVKKIGRWVYQLCISDGITSLFVKDGSKLYLGDFGRIINVDEESKDKWKNFFKTIPGNKDAEVSTGGGRHSAAIQCAYNPIPYDGKGKIVFCVSQDGFIDVYMKDDWLKLR